MNEGNLSSTTVWHTWLTKELIWSPELGLITGLISKSLRATSQPTIPANGAQYRQAGEGTDQMRSNWWQLNIIKAHIGEAGAQLSKVKTEWGRKLIHISWVFKGKSEY